MAVNQKQPPSIFPPQLPIFLCSARFQVSWFRSSDSQVLSSGWTKFTGDRRFKVVPADRSHTWGLDIRNVTPADSGQYLCQVNTEPKITLEYYISVTGKTYSSPRPRVGFF